VACQLNRQRCRHLSALSTPARRAGRTKQPFLSSSARRGPAPRHDRRAAQEEFKRLAADFAARELAPHAARWDAEKEFSVATLRAAAALGFGGVFCGEDVGGSALSRADGAVIFEVAARAAGPQRHSSLSSMQASRAADSTCLTVHAPGGCLTNHLPRAFWFLSQELAAADISHTAYLTIHNMVRLAAPCALPGARELPPCPTAAAPDASGRAAQVAGCIDRCAASGQPPPWRASALHGSLALWSLPAA